MARYVIGIDGGGTKTIALLAEDTGKIIGRTEGGTSAYQVIGGEKLKQVLRELVSGLLEECKIPKDRLAHLFAALSGVGRPGDRKAVTELLTELRISQEVSVDSDAVAALAGAFGGAEGIILISGTGAICFGKGKDGQVRRSGGWGYLLGDEGSGYFIGQQGLIAALKDLDGRGAKTKLRPLFEARYQLNQIDEIIPKIYQGKIDRAEVASLAPVVFDLAEAGDKVAQEIIQQAGVELGKLAKAVAEKLNLTGSKIQVALIGSVFKRKAVLTPAIAAELRQLSDSVEILEPQFQPAAGAVILALQKLGVPIDERVLTNLSNSAKV